MNNVILLCLISLFFGCAGTFVVLTRFFRRYLQLSSSQRQEYELQLENTLKQLKDQKMEIADQKKAIQELIYQYHHSGVNPLAKRFRGAADVGTRPITELRQCITLLGQENHYKWAPIAMKQVDEIEMWWNKGIEICLNMEDEVRKTADKFNHLQ